MVPSVVHMCCGSGVYFLVCWFLSYVLYGASENTNTWMKLHCDGEERKLKLEYAVP